MKDFVQSASVARKIVQTFLYSEVMQNAITKFIRKRLEGAITDAMKKRTVTIFAEKMGIYDKMKVYPAGNWTNEPPLDVVIPERDVYSSSGGGQYSDQPIPRLLNSSVKDGSNIYRTKHAPTRYHKDSH